MRVSNELSLFGFDLGRLLGFVRLGVSQLLWGDEAGLRDAFAPELLFLSLETIKTDDLDRALLRAGQDGKPYLAAVMPEADTLHFTVTLPRAAEPYLEDVVRGEISAKTPFGLENTSWGFRIVKRRESELDVTIAIVAKQTAKDAFAEASRVLSSYASGLELWAAARDIRVQLRDFQSDTRRSEYLYTLKLTAARLLLAIAGVLLLLSVPSMWVSQTDAQLESLLTEARRSSAYAVESRDRLMSTIDRQGRARDYFGQYVDYRPWLHRVAALTPDSVYFNRFSFEERSLTISGLAENAAEFQSQLVNTTLFSELSAPSAFTRDDRAGRERFTLTMKVPVDAEL